MRIVCIGNSIVNGYPHKRSQCFVSLWRAASGHEIVNKGENGDITPNVLARFEKDVILHKPSTVVILTGTNDFIYRVCTPTETMDYLDRMASLAKTNSIEVVLLTPLLLDAALAEQHWLPDVDYHAVNEKLKTLRDLMLAYGEKKGVKVIDVQEKYSQLYSQANVSEYLLDGLHPTIRGHEAISRFLPD